MIVRLEDAFGMMNTYYNYGAMNWNDIGNLLEWRIDKCFDTTMKAKSLNG